MNAENTPEEDAPQKRPAPYGVRFPKGVRPQLEDAARRKGMSLHAYLIEAALMRMNADAAEKGRDISPKPMRQSDKKSRQKTIKQAAVFEIRRLGSNFNQALKALHRAALEKGSPTHSDIESFTQSALPVVEEAKAALARIMAHDSAR